MALVTDDFEKDVLGALPDNKGVMIEDVNAQAVHFALLFQVAGDVKSTRHVLYNCTATRPQAGGQTKGETVEPQTQTTTITATSIHIADLDKDISKAKTTRRLTKRCITSGSATSISLQPWPQPAARRLKKGLTYVRRGKDRDQGGPHAGYGVCGRLL